MIKEFMPVKGYEGSYEVSKSGQVKSLARSVKINSITIARLNEGFMKTWVGEHGDVVVQLSKHSVRQIHTVKLLIKEAFNYE